MSSIFEYAQSGKPQPKIASQDHDPQNSSIFEYAKNLPTPEKEPSALSNVQRHIARSGSRIAETIAGLPGDVIQAPERLLSYATGKETPDSYKKFKKLIPILNLPGSQEFRDITKRIGNGYLEPKTSGEALSDEIISDAASLMIPVKGKVPFMKSILTATGSNLVGEGLHELTGSEQAKQYGKLGGMLSFSLFNPRGASKLGSAFYDEAKAAIPSNASTSAASLARNLRLLRNQMTQGTLAPSEKFVVDEIDAILGKVKNGRINPAEAWASKRSLNEKLQKFIYESPEKASKARARKFAKQIGKDLNNTLEQYGNTNSRFYEPFKKAEEVYGVTQSSKRISNFMRKNMKIAGATAGSSVFELLTGHPKAAAASIGAAATGAAALKTGELMYRIYKSPVLRKYYLNALGAAAKQDSVAMNRNLQHLYDDMKKDNFSFESEETSKKNSRSD